MDGVVIPLAVVDDEQILLHGIRYWLELAGPGVEVVSTAETVPELIDMTTRARVVLLDLRLRDGRSVESNVVDLLAAGYSVVTYSTRDDDRLVHQATRAGAHSYVRKSADPTEVREAIVAASRGERYTSRAHAALIERDHGPGTPELSRQEREAFRLYASGLTLTSVARRLDVKAGTAKSYLDRVRDKYEQVGRAARTKLELRDRAVEDGLLPPLDLAE